jgi:hypothetical protein
MIVALEDVGESHVISTTADPGPTGIMAVLQHGANITIGEGWPDISPVTAAAWYWHDWHGADYDSLVGLSERDSAPQTRPASGRARPIYVCIHTYIVVRHCRIIWEIVLRIMFITRL